MALKRTKKKTGKLKTLRSAGGGSAVETSPLRPVHIEKIAPCMHACPQGTEIRKVLTTIALAEKHEKGLDEAFKEAWEILTRRNPMPAVCGWVCPHPCETDCNRKEKDAAVSINAMERFIGDWGIEQGFALSKDEDAAPRAEKVAVIGAGPAGLCCAYHLARKGYPVTVFEAFSKPGGMLRYGIPPYRLPRKILDAEIRRILDLGVELKCNVAVGKDIPYEQIEQEYDAVFVGIGAHTGRPLRLEGEDTENILTGAEYLNRVNSGNPVEVGEKVVVIGGGDTAIDAARVARRHGAEVSILYRRTRKEMPAIEEEIKGALEEGVKIEYLVAPVGIEREGSRARTMVFQRMELGEPDESGRRRPVPIEGSEFEVEASFFIAAISQAPDFDGLDAVGNPKDWVKADPRMKVEGREKAFAGGDVIGLGLVTVALAQGRMAARTIHELFRGIVPKERKNPPPVIGPDKVLLKHYEEKPRAERRELPVQERFANPEAPIVEGLTREQAVEEAKRCMSCGFCIECGECWNYCQDQAVIKPLKPGEKYAFKLEFCNGCKKCAEVCPCGYIELYLPGEAPRYDYEE